MTTVAEAVADDLVARGTARVFGLCGGHIQPIWDALARRGVDVVDVRHEGAAVMMAHAAAELTDSMAVALVTAGPGLTNAVTGIANASVSGVPLLVLSGRTPRPQTGMGAMQDIPQADLLRPLCRSVHPIWDQRHVHAELDAAYAAALGSRGRPGPVYVDLPVDLQGESMLPANMPRPVQSRGRTAHRPDLDRIADAGRLIADSHRVLVIAGRGARRSGEAITAFLDQVDGAFLDGSDSRGTLPADHPRYVPAMRGRAIAEADLVVTVGRRLDFQLAYGSSAVFHPDARFLRIGTTYEQTAANRRADVELVGDPIPTLAALVETGARPTASDRAWTADLFAANQQRVERLTKNLLEAEPDESGRMHPYRLIDALNSHVIDDDTVVIADGGDILSFARVALRAPTYLDCGPLGCLGVGVPFAVGACVSQPGRRAVALIGDGSLGFHLAEIDTAVRHQVPALFVVANNASWAIERHDQNQRYDGNLVGVDLPGCRYDLVAKGLGAYAEHVRSQGELAGALRRAQEHLPALVDVEVSSAPISPDFRSGLAGVPTFQPLATWDAAERALRPAAARAC